MNIETVAEDEFGAKAYSALFDEIMSDLNKAVLIDKVKLVMKPEVPLFVFSLVLRARPAEKTIVDVSTARAQPGGVHLTIVQERYAPEILSALWNRYGRNNVVQQTRFDLEVVGATEEELAGMAVSSGEEDLKEIIGAVWRIMPEGIKNRRTFITGNVITVTATEEVLLPEMLDEGMAVHLSMGGSADV